MGLINLEYTLNICDHNALDDRDLMVLVGRNFVQLN